MATVQRILVVDDDKQIVRLLRAYLEQAGFHVMTAFDGETALFMLRQERPDLVVLDLMLPNRDGWSVTRSAREDAVMRDIPIIMLTARVEETDRVLGLELGADDYVTKPFSPREMVARIRSVLRRSQASNAPRPHKVIRIGDLSMDIGRHEVRLCNQLVDLTPTEYKILHTLMESPGYAFTRVELAETSLGYLYEGMERTLDSHIKNLRRKIEPDPRQPKYIETVYGMGYRMGSPGSKEE